MNTTGITCRKRAASASDVRDTHKRVAVVLADGPQTAYEIAQRLGNTFDGITSCLRGMVSRREVVRLKPKQHGKPYRYRLREVAA